MKPLVSILMPMRNAAAYLEECLDSIIAQDYEQWELLITDDRSTDHSREIADHYASTDSRIQLASNSGRGIIDALRSAYARSQSAFITRMDADDLMSKGKLRVMTDELVEHGPGHLVLGCVEYFSEEGLGDGYKRYAEWLNGLTSKGNNWSEIYRECVIPSPCWMLYREDLDAIGAFDRQIYPEDYDLCFRMARAKLKCLPSNKVLHLWRDHGTRASRNDPNYKDNSFIALKCFHFSEWTYDKNKELILWGAGRRGKAIAKELQKKKLPFSWICNNEQKVGKDIYSQVMKPIEYLDQSGQSKQIIIAVANRDEQILIEKTCLGLSQDFFFFC